MLIKRELKFLMTMDKSKHNICIICDSTYQFLNLLGVLNMRDYTDGVIDVFINKDIIKKNPGIDSLLRKWRVKNIYLTTSSEKDNLYQKIIKYISPVCYINSRCIDRIKYVKYDIIFTAVPTHFAASIININKCAKLYYYEDGLSSYMEDMVKRFYSLHDKILYKLFGFSLARLYPVEMYINEPKLYEGLMCPESKECRIININNGKILREIGELFPINNSLYKENSVIFLSQPILLNGIKNKFDEIFNTIMSIDNIIVRPHPTEKDRFIGYKGNIDFDCGIWELLCSNLTNNNTLIGYYSTAQFIPTILYKVQPTLIFLYRLFSDCLQKDVIERMDQTVNGLKQQYEDGGKIFTPNSMEEFIFILKNNNYY